MPLTCGTASHDTTEREAHARAGSRSELRSVRDRVVDVAEPGPGRLISALINQPTHDRDDIAWPRS